MRYWEFYSFGRNHNRFTNIIAEHLHRKCALSSNIATRGLKDEMQNQATRVIVDVMNKIILNKVIHAKYCLVVFNKTLMYGGVNPDNYVWIYGSLKCKNVYI